ncbi:MAG: hypothetical protein M3463_07605 [Verrucomicrobiota bacterium]|nr:hypothetical protein [Verrucomicrobiota bacterium]
MRGRITDQDLADYALNELEPHERLYLESMLAISPECRNDVYEMVEVAQMLDEALSQESAIEAAMLTPEQRQALLRVKEPSPMHDTFVRAASVLGMAACVAFALTNYERWEMNQTALRVAKVSTEMSRVVAEVVAAPETSAALSQSLVSLRALVEEPARWMPENSMVCTPPSWREGEAMASVSMPGVGGMPTAGDMTY